MPQTDERKRLIPTPYSLRSPVNWQAGGRSAAAIELAVPHNASLTLKTSCGDVTEGYSCSATGSLSIAYRGWPCERCIFATGLACLVERRGARPRTWSAARFQNTRMQRLTNGRFRVRDQVASRLSPVHGSPLQSLQKPSPQHPQPNVPRPKNVDPRSFMRESESLSPSAETRLILKTSIQTREGKPKAWVQSPMN